MARCILDLIHFADLYFGKEQREAMKTIVSIMGAASLLFAGYVVVRSLPDVRRYIRISTV
jgi:uncharacterized protein DUF6893